MAGYRRLRDNIVCTGCSNGRREECSGPSCPCARSGHAVCAKFAREDDVPVQYLIHPALRERLDGWLESQGLRVDRLPAEVEGEESLPTYLISPKEYGPDMRKSWEPPTHPGSDPARRRGGPIA